jgi:hypothetical protein
LREAAIRVLEAAADESPFALRRAIELATAVLVAFEEMSADNGGEETA